MDSSSIDNVLNISYFRNFSDNEIMLMQDIEMASVYGRLRHGGLRWELSNNLLSTRNNRYILDFGFRILELRYTFVFFYGSGKTLGTIQNHRTLNL